MDLYIIGAGNVGGFVAYHAHEMGHYNIKGFIDDDIGKLGSKVFGYSVVGTTDLLLSLKEPTAVVLAIANPLAKEVLLEKIVNNHMLVFPNFIHPNAWLGHGVEIGIGNIIYPGVSINYETEVKNFCTINLNSAIGHNCTLEDFVTLSPGVNFGGFTHVSVKGFVGIGATTLQGTKIGYEATVGGQTMVLQNVPDYLTAVGNPNRLLNRKVYISKNLKTTERKTIPLPIQS